ncbi:MAG: hypothetical protein CMJ42_16295 [Phyllobacteriaceae bacterium]|nr:hypothetical protein [Phyllobacteriaceae bacterium]MBA89254.1 hypothetical protein [Phyllobacteriaceae bacterium]
MKPRTAYRVALMTGRSMDIVIEATTPEIAIEIAEYLYDRYGHAAFRSDSELIIDIDAEENA